MNLNLSECLVHGRETKLESMNDAGMKGDLPWWRPCPGTHLGYPRHWVVVLLAECQVLKEKGIFYGKSYDLSFSAHCQEQQNRSIKEKERK